MKPTVYLAGPIAGQTYAGCTDWRQRAADYLLRCGFAVASPMRFKQFLSKMTVMHGNAVEGNPLTTAKGICTRDRNDVAKCDVVLMNLLGAKIVSIGTMVELGWADAHRKPVVVVMEPGNIHEHCFVRELAGYIVPDLDAGLEVVRAILYPRESY